MLKFCYTFLIQNIYFLFSLISLFVGVSKCDQIVFPENPYSSSVAQRQLWGDEKQGREQHSSTTLEAGVKFAPHDKLVENNPGKESSWGPYSQRPSNSFHTLSRHHQGCPPGATGQFPFELDCRRFVNCYNGRGYLTLCSEGTLFNPETRECDFPSKVRCISHHQPVIGYPVYGYQHHHSPSQPSHPPGYSSQHFNREPLPGFGGYGSSSVHHKSQSIPENEGRIVWPEEKITSTPIHPERSLTVMNKAEETRQHQNPYYSGAVLKNPINKGSTTGDATQPKSTYFEETSPLLTQNTPSPYLIPPRQQTTRSRVYENTQHQPFNTEQGNKQNIPSPYLIPPRQQTAQSRDHEVTQHPPFNADQGNKHSGVQPPFGFHQSGTPSQTFNTQNIKPNKNSADIVENKDSVFITQPWFPTNYNNSLEQTLKPYEGRTNSTSRTQYYLKPSCPPGFLGLMPHPNCSKFLSCANGRTFVMDCAPGTRFDPKNLICNHSYKVNCNKAYGNFQENIEQTTTLPEPLLEETDVLDSIYVRFGGENIQDIDTGLDLTSSASFNKETTIGQDITKENQSFPNRTEHLYKPHPQIRNMKGFFIRPTVKTRSYEELKDIVEILSQQEIPNNFTKVKNPSLPKNVLHEASNKSQQPNVTNTPLESTTSKSSKTLKSESHVFRVQNSNSSKLSSIQTNYNGKPLVGRQVLRLRGGPNAFEGFVEIQLSQGVWGQICDLTNQWSIHEADIVCKNMGFDRGAEMSWQGYPASVHHTHSKLISTDKVNCFGYEDSILDCKISNGKNCDMEKNAVWVRCRTNSQSQCMPGETAFGENCYLLVVPKEEIASGLVGFSHGEALAHCQSNGGHLLDVTNQMENDYISEWLISKNFGESIMTSGVGISIMGRSLWLWEGSEDPFLYHNWWPGWERGQSIPPKTGTGRSLCIVLRRFFPCADSANVSETNLCDSEYYFWDQEDCGVMSNKYPYICKRSAAKIGCIRNNGINYQGLANISKEGNMCLKWDLEEVKAALRFKISETALRKQLQGHNFCRNIGGLDSEPWCYIKDDNGLKKEYCDIPQCSTKVEKSAQFIGYKCSEDQFSCKINSECISSAWVCDGQKDCTNGYDEEECSNILDKFSAFNNSRLMGHDVEKLSKMTANLCAQYCLEAKYECRSFSYLAKTEECLLSDSNVGLSGNLFSNDSQWIYYELTSKSVNCDDMFKCDNNKCINKTSECNGRNDCGDRSDENNCSINQGIQLRLSGGSKSNEGTIEIKVSDEWGLICDDQFDLRDADVICRHLGFQLGASELRKHSQFKTNVTNRTKYFIDDLQCQGEENSIAECDHNGWGIHNCGPDEIAGVICKVSEIECGFNFWQCKTSGECIPLGFLCDNVPDCTDKSDEDAENCKSSVEVRLIGQSRGGVTKEGRLEVRRFGVWGTVCDDDFGEKEAEVVCNSLGFQGPAKAFKEAAFGAGSGIIWLDQVHCLGNETNVANCMHDSWGQTNCRHNEDVSVACSSPIKGYNEEVLRRKNIHQIQSAKEQKNIEDILPKRCGTVSSDLEVISTYFKPKVVSGFETVKGSHPWQASVRLKSVSGKSSHWCGAIVISSLHVLTAGHCLRDYIKSSYFIRAGDFDTEVPEDSEQDVEIEEIWIHEKLDEGTRLNNDIGLVKLKYPGLEFNKWVAPACLPPKNAPSNIAENCTISGWGSNGNPGSGFARTLHASWISLLPIEDCKSEKVYGKEIISEGMFCAGSLVGGPDSCQGDSGGPFLCRKNGLNTLFGITSWGHGCGRMNSPGVYTKVSHYLEWIEEKLKRSVYN